MAENGCMVLRLQTHFAWLNVVHKPIHCFCSLWINHQSFVKTKSLRIIYIYSKHIVDDPDFLYGLFVSRLWQKMVAPPEPICRPGSQNQKKTVQNMLLMNKNELNHQNIKNMSWLQQDLEQYKFNLYLYKIDRPLLNPWI